MQAKMNPAVGLAAHWKAALQAAEEEARHVGLAVKILVSVVFVLAVSLFRIR